VLVAWGKRHQACSIRRHESRIFRKGMLLAWMKILLLFICKLSGPASPVPKAKEKKEHTVKNNIFNNIFDMNLVLVCLSKEVSGGPQDFQTTTAFIVKRDLVPGVFLFADPLIGFAEIIHLHASLHSLFRQGLT
jgi:hypothetical protein